MKKDELLQVLTTVAKGIADTFGTNCETLVQDLDTMDHKIVAIFNGHVTERAIGSTEGIQDGSTSTYQTTIERLQSPHINQLAVHNGKSIKSTTIPLRAEDGVLGLGINFDYTRLKDAQQALVALTSIEGFLFKGLEVEQLTPMDALFRDAVGSLHTDKELKELSREERRHLLRKLSFDHFFEQQKSVPYAAEQLGISRYTIYKDLQEIGTTPNS